MAKSTAKAEATMRDLKDRLALRLAGSARIDTVREAKDSEGWPVLILSDGGNEAAGQPVIGLRMKAVDAVSKDVFGNALVAFAPHELELAYELDGAVPEADAKDIITVMVETGKIGARTLVKEIADGTAVTAANMDSAAVALALEADLKWPTKGV